MILVVLFSSIDPWRRMIGVMRCPGNIVFPRWRWIRMVGVVLLLSWWWRMVILQGRRCHFTILILGWPPRRHSLCSIRRRPVSETLWFGWRSGGCCWRRNLGAASRRYVAIDAIGSRRDWNGNLTNRNTFDIVLVATVVRSSSNRSVATFR